MWEGVEVVCRMEAGSLGMHAPVWHTSCSCCLCVPLLAEWTHDVVSPQDRC
jgi:hypothetical protein